MTKAELITKIANKTGIQKDEIEKVLEVFFVTVKNSVAQAENIYVRGFGSFIVKQRAQKTARNIALNSTIIVPAHNIPFFKPSKDFIHQVKERTTVE
jgi:DNA-binding protein HU-beta